MDNDVESSGVRCLFWMERIEQLHYSIHFFDGVDRRNRKRKFLVREEFRERKVDVVHLSVALLKVWRNRIMD